MENEARSEAQEALLAIANARSSAAERVLTPWWYHPVLGLLVAGFVLIYALGSPAVMAAGIAVYFAGIAVLVGLYRRKAGVWVSGFQAGAASRWAYVAMSLFVLFMALAVVVGRFTPHVWLVWVFGAAMFVIIVVCGRLFDMKLRAQLRETP